MVVTESVLESVLVKLQAITMNSNDQVFGGFCSRICLQFKTVAKSAFSKVSDLYEYVKESGFIRLQAVPINIKALLKMAVMLFCAGVSFW